MLVTCLFLFFLQSVSSKNLDRVENPSPGEKIPLSCQDEEECEYHSRQRVGREWDAEWQKRQVDCSVVSQKERIICDLFMGKRDAAILEGGSGKRGVFANPILRQSGKPCITPWCRFGGGTGKKKFMVKKAVHLTGRQGNLNDVSSDNGNKPCDDLTDLMCHSSGGGIGRKRSIPQFDQDNCSDPEYSGTEECRLGTYLGRKRSFSS